MFYTFLILTTYVRIVLCMIFYCCLFLCVHLASVHVFSQKSNLQFELLELLYVKIHCNVTKPQPITTDLMSICSGILDQWDDTVGGATQHDSSEIKNLKDIHRNDPVTHHFLWLWVISKETKIYVEGNEHIKLCLMTWCCFYWKT